MVDLQGQDGTQEIRPRSSPSRPAASPAAYFPSLCAGLLPGTHRSAALGAGQSAEGSDNGL